MVLINGIKTDQWSIADRAFLYGDGCFTTMLVKFGSIQHWSLHLERLKRDTDALLIKNIDWQRLEADLFTLINSVQTLPRSVIKILISRGIGGQGYSPKNCDTPTVITSSHDYPAHYSKWQKDGIELTILKQRLGHSPLAGVKHLNRLEQVLLKQELEQFSADDGVVCCLDHHVVETTSGNIFWRKGQTLYTPDLSKAGVLGTQRAVAIRLAQSLNWQVEQVHTNFERLLEADEIFICNALMEFIPVRKIEHTHFSSDSFCQELMLRL